MKKYYIDVRYTDEVKEALDHMTEVLGESNASVAAMCITMVYNYFNDKQLTLEAPVYLPKDGRRKN